MQIAEIILFILAYTIGVITLFLQIVCYKRKIEHIETILFIGSFFLLIMALSVSLLFDISHHAENEKLEAIVYLCMVLLGLTTPLNIFVERHIKVPKLITVTLYIVSAVLFLLVVSTFVVGVYPFTDTVVSTFIGVSVISSMVLLRNTKPHQRIKHREKIERRMAVAFIVVLPLTLFIEFFSEKFERLNFLQTDTIITVPVLFIMMATSKFLDDLTRLSLFKPENTIIQQNVTNYNLTPREFEIAELLIKGFSYAQISGSLFISMPTVKTHVTNIYKKVNVNNKMELFNTISN